MPAGFCPGFFDRFRAIHGNGLGHGGDGGTLASIHKAAIVGNRYGKGQTLYIGALLGPKAWDLLMPLIFTRFSLSAQNPIAAHPKVESLPERGAWLVTNSSHEVVKVAVTGTFKDLISGKTIRNELTLPAFGMAMLDSEIGG
jgi:hypothetical protein